MRVFRAKYLLVGVGFSLRMRERTKSGISSNATKSIFNQLGAIFSRRDLL